VWKLCHTGLFAKMMGSIPSSRAHFQAPISLFLRVQIATVNIAIVPINVPLAPEVDVGAGGGNDVGG
jgi:hypothetical protein